MTYAFQQLLSAFERGGIVLLDADREAILGAAARLDDDVLDKAVTAFADNLPSGGIKSAEFGGIKDALIASEPQFDQIINEKVAALYDAILNALKKAQGP